jgi:endogenous inhibitor of DNA gyrase (YacG/DUF329 family)
VSIPLIHSIHNGLRRYEGTRLSKPRPCPDCGKTDYHKHDTRPRLFAVLITEDGFEEVTVAVQRYWCKHCGKSVDSDMAELFYEGCLYGKSIVDLCLYYATENPFNAVERIFHTYYGIQVDRDTIQRYAELFAERVEDRHGVTVADEPLSLNFLSLLFGTSTADQFREEYPAFWDEEPETFTDPLSTNAIEGGNWRLKYGLRTPYARVPPGTRAYGLTRDS